LEVPVIEGVSAAVKLIEGLIALVLYQGSYDRWKSSGMIVMSID